MNLLRRILDTWRGYDATVRDLTLALLVLAVSLLLAPYGTGTEIGGLPTRPFDPLGAVITVLQCLPLALLRVRPVTCLALVSAGFAADQALGYHSIATLALPVTVLSTGAHLDRYRRATAVVFTAVYVLFSALLFVVGGASESPWEFVTFFAVVVVLWIVGSWVRSARMADADRRRRAAEEERAAERARLARELHDVVTHHVTAMVLQAEAARYLTATPERLQATLTDVTDSGRQAISDLRHLLDLLSPDHGTGTAPPAEGFRVLVERARRAGQPVELTQAGTPPPRADGARTVAYRVVQEALTNALKYDHGSGTAVDVRYDDDGIAVRVSTDGTGTAAAPGGSGRGLRGLRERVDVLGGDFHAGRSDDGAGFTVRARIPAVATP